jgi:hypothetical protein
MLNATSSPLFKAKVIIREQSMNYCSQEDPSLLSKGWKANKMSFGMPKGVG